MPRYTPKKWNRNSHRRKSHNCYAYFLNKTSRRFDKACRKIKKKNKTKKCQKPQPGFVTGYKRITNMKQFTCKEIEKRMFADNKYLKRASYKKHCSRGYYKGALVVDAKPKNNVSSYHYYRQNNDAMWSHKDGEGYATNKDASGRLIYDPKKADRDYRRGKKKGKNYTRFCGYYCVPNASRKKRFKINSR